MAGFIAHFIVYAAVNGLLVGIWALTNDGGTANELDRVMNDGMFRAGRLRDGWVDQNDFWPIWPMMTWGVALSIHAAFVVLYLPKRIRRKRHRQLESHYRRVAAEKSRPALDADCPISSAFGAVSDAFARIPAPPRPPGRNDPGANRRPSRRDNIDPRSNRGPSRRARNSAGKRWVAVMLLDVAGSTRYNEVLGDDAWSRMLLKLREMVRDMVDNHHGTEVGTQGDSLLAHFDTPTDAVLCAVDVQRELARRREDGAIVPEVRIGVHAGDVVDDGDGDIVGRVVNLVARVSGAADPGEILVTEPVADELGSRVPFDDRGLRELKGVARPRHLLAALWKDPVPAPPSSNGRRPAEHDLAEVEVEAVDTVEPVDHT
jgi:class 3 adenylate cyclase